MDIKALKLVDDKPPIRMDRKASRRLRLSTGAMLQSVIAQEEASGSKTTGRKWYWKEADGSYRASLKFGRSVLELDKGKFSIRCEDLSEVSETFEKLASMVVAEQFDEQLDRLAIAARKQFARKQSTS